MWVLKFESSFFEFIFFYFPWSFPRHPPGHAYFDPNDFLEGIQQDIEREELEYEVNIYFLPFLLPSSFDEDLHADTNALL